MRATRRIAGLAGRHSGQLGCHGASRLKSPAEILVNIDEQIAAFHRFDEGTPEHLLGDLLGYWTNEWWAYLMPKLAQCQQDTTDLLDARDAIAGLRRLARTHDSERRAPNSRSREWDSPSRRNYSTDSPTATRTCLYVRSDGSWTTATIERLDHDAGELDLFLGEKNQEAGDLPVVVVDHGWVETEVKRLALADFAIAAARREGAQPRDRGAAARRTAPVPPRPRTC